MASTAVTQLALENDLQHALPRGELHLVYQPVFDLWANRVAGLETLVRWTHPHRGRVPPTSFISLAEESGLIVEIGEWVIAAACATMRDWQTATGRADVDLGVNLSARQFNDSRLVDTIEASLTTAATAPRRMASVTYALPSNRSPRIATNMSPGDIVLVSIEKPDISRSLPGPDTFAPMAAATEAGVAFVDLLHPSLELYKAAKAPLTISGVHLSDEGNRQLTEVISSALFGKAVSASPAMSSPRCDRRIS